MTERSPLSRLLGIEMLDETAEKAVARLEIRADHKTPTGVVHSGTILSLADDCATRVAANRANDEGSQPWCVHGVGGFAFHDARKSVGRCTDRRLEDRAVRAAHYRRPDCRHRRRR